MDAFLEEKDAHVSEPVGSQNSPVPGGHMCHVEWVTDSQVDPPDDGICRHVDLDIPPTLALDDDDTLVVDA